MPKNRGVLSKRPKGLLLAFILVIATIILIYMARMIYEVLTSNLEDFYLYYISASGFRQGLDLYGMTDISEWETLAKPLGVPNHVAPYRYPPLLAVMIMPLLSLAPRTAGFVWTVINGMATMGAIALLAAVLPGGLKRLPWMWVIAAVFIPALSTLYAGQVNALVFLSIALALWAFKRGQPLGGGLALSLGVMLKLMPLTLVAYFLWRRQWRVVGGAVIGVVVLSLACVPFVGWDILWSYGRHMTSHADPQVLQVNPLNQSLLGFFGRLLTSYSWGTAWGNNPALAWTLGRGLCLVIFIATFLLCWPGRPLQDFLFEEVSLVIIATLLFPSIAWYHLQILLLIPIFTLLWNRPKNPYRRKLAWIAIGCLVMINLQGILWPVLLKEVLLLSLATYAMLILWGTLAWELFRENRAFILGSRLTVQSTTQ